MTPASFRLTALLLLSSALIPTLQAQKDTAFWLVAPDIIDQTGQGPHTDHPVAFRFCSYELPATVTVEQPANPGFPVQTLELAPGSTASLMFPPFFEAVEAEPGQPGKHGFLIRSTGPVSAFYEVLGAMPYNPEIFSLKGRHALGLEFYVPMQTYLANSSVDLPQPSSGFDLVATQDSTWVTVAPTRPVNNLVPPAAVAFMLDRGQTYSGRADGPEPNDHPAGTRITATRPIAVAMKDDLVAGEPHGEFCRDLLGNQLVPDSRAGTIFVVQKGQLNGIYERVFLVGAGPAGAVNAVSLDGQVVGAIAPGQVLPLPVLPGPHLINTWLPVHLLQVTGTGCEVAADIVPPLDCGEGSAQVRFVRTNADEYRLMLTTRNGRQGSFALNGNTGWIPPGAFQPVPGSNGAYVAAKLMFSTDQIPVGEASVVTNSSGPFQLAVLNGDDSGGSRFAFLSGFGNQTRVEEHYALCSGESIEAHGLQLSEPGIFYREEAGGEGCDRLVEITVTRRYVPLQREVVLCRGDSVVIGQQVYAGPATVVDTLFYPEGCDTVRITVIRPEEGPTPFLPADTVLCPGDRVVLTSPLAVTHWNGGPESPVFTVDTLGLVIASGLTAEGCPRLDSIFIGSCCSDEALARPNVFSPNGDGINDTYCLFPAVNCRPWLFRIFNRWGREVFATTNPDQCWDGRQDGSDQPSDLYFWLAEIRSDRTGKMEILKGEVTLLR
jgi:gliding motility-associated-like protein